MSSDFTVPPRSLLSDANDYTHEIHDVFNQHWKMLNKERQETIDKINQWHHDFKEHIKKYVNEQKLLINDHYNRLRPIFDEKHKENLEIANAYHATQQVIPFDELRQACQLLKFQVATLTSSKYDMERPEVIITEEQLETKKLEEKDSARRRRRRNKENDNKMENTSGECINSPPNPITSNSKQADDRQSSKIKSKRNNDQSQANTDDSKNQVINDDESYNKCPICFMIFPLNMTRDNRQQHINEHYTDD